VTEFTVCWLLESGAPNIGERETARGSDSVTRWLAVIRKPITAPPLRSRVKHRAGRGSGLYCWVSTKRISPLDETRY